MLKVWNTMEKVNFVLKSFPFNLTKTFLIFASVYRGEIALFMTYNGGSSGSIVHESKFSKRLTTI